MKKIISLLLSLLIFAQTALACDQVRCYYATSCTVPFELYITDATTGAKFVKTAAHASGDTYIMKDEGADTNTTNSFIDEGAGYSIVLTSAETTAARILLRIEDQSGPQIWADKCVNIETIARTASDNGSAYYSYPTVDMAAVSGDTTAADALETMLDGTGGQTLSLGKLAISATTGDAVTIATAGGNGDGIDVSGNGSGSAITATGGATGHGINAVGGSTTGNAIRGTNTSGTAVNFISSGGNGNGMLLTANGTGAGLALFGGATGAGLQANGGSTSGDAVHTTVVSGDGFDGAINGNITGNLSGSVGSVTAMGAGAIDAASIAADAIGASELASDAATEIGTASWATATRQLTGTQAFNNTGNTTGNISGSVGSVTGAVGSVTAVSSGAITSGSFAANAIDASAIAPSAIGASELATDAIGAAEVAADAVTEIASGVGSISLGAGAITSATFATGAIDANAIAADAIGASEVAANAIAASELGADAATEIASSTLSSNASAYNVAGTIGEKINSGGSGGGGGGTDEISSGTAQSVGLTSVRLASSENYGTNVLADNTSVVITSASTGAGQTRCIKSNVGTTDTVTLTQYFTIVPTGTVTYSLRATPNCNPAKWHQGQ